MKHTSLFAAASLAAMFGCSGLLHANVVPVAPVPTETAAPTAVPEVSVLSLVTGWAFLLLRRSRGH